MKNAMVIILIGFLFDACCDKNATVQSDIKHDTLVVYKYDTVSSSLPYASVAGIYNGKVSKGELMHCSGLKLLNNAANYKIISFKCTDITDLNYKRKNIVYCSGPSFSEELLTLFSGLDGAAMISFENITAVNPKNDTVTLNSMILHLPG